MRVKRRGCLEWFHFRLFMKADFCSLPPSAWPTTVSSHQTNTQMGRYEGKQIILSSRNIIVYTNRKSRPICSVLAADGEGNDNDTSGHMLPSRTGLTCR